MAGSGRVAPRGSNKQVTPRAQRRCAGDLCTRNANAKQRPEILIGSPVIKETDNRRREVPLTCAVLLLVKIMEKA